MIIKWIDKIIYQVVNSLDYCFSENGLYALKKGEFFAKRVIYYLKNIKIDATLFKCKEFE